MRLNVTGQKNVLDGKIFLLNIRIKEQSLAFFQESKGLPKWLECVESSRLRCLEISWTDKM